MMRLPCARFRDEFHLFASSRRPYGAAIILVLPTQDCVRSRELILGYFPFPPTGGRCKQGFAGSGRIRENG